MSFNFVSKNIAVPSGYEAHLSGAFTGDFDGDGSDLANVSHIEQSHQGLIDDYRIVFFNNSTSSYSNERNIRGSSELRYSPTDQEFEIGTDKVKLILTDNGSGIPQHILNKIFNLYFTTKAQGTGIGLSIVQKIIMEHGGTISVESKENLGASFTIILPIIFEA